MTSKNRSYAQAIRKPPNILDEWNGYPEIFSFSQGLEKFLGNIYSFEQLFYRKNSLGAPVFPICDSPLWRLARRSFSV